MEKKNPRIIIGLILVTCLIFSVGFGVFAFADNGDNGSLPPPKKGSIIPREQMTNILTALVAGNIINQEKMDSIMQYLDSKAEEQRAQLQGQEDKFAKGKGLKGRPLGFGQQNGMIEDLLNNNIITADEADAIKAKAEQLAMEARESNLRDRLNSYVQNGIITENQVNSIISFLGQRAEERKAEMKIIINMIPEERKAYFQNNKASRENPIATMISQGILTKEQADALAKALLPPSQGPKGHHVKLEPYGPFGQYNQQNQNQLTEPKDSQGQQI